MCEQRARQACPKQYDDYRSHPLSTSEAIPCIDNAKAKISAESAPSRAINREVAARDEVFRS
jgi:hypothetical protein